MKPRLLDLFCGAGGAAVGYDRAGFDVVGVDLNPQPRYPFRLRQAALDRLVAARGGYGLNSARRGIRLDAIHASPPCGGHGVEPAMVR